MSNPVVGTNTAGVGVTGTGSNYGVSGSSTGAFAGVSGLSSTAAPGVLGQGKGTGPGVMGVCGLAELLDTLLTNVDAAATAFAGENPGCAGIFVGAVVVTGNIQAQSATVTEALTADSITSTTSVTAASITVTTSVTAATVALSGDLTAKNATLQGSLTAASGTFSGNVQANDVLLSGADCAEEFDMSEGLGIEPGSVVVFGDDGSLSTSSLPYNKRVAGVISGAGAYRPGVILDRRADSRGRQPVALIGKVYCKVDASHGPIGIGDPLTTSPTAGCAMRASVPGLSFGAVIGKALAPCERGCGLIPILVSLQ
jgi:hypothetical protein